MIDLLAAAADNADAEGFSLSLEPLWTDQGVPLAIMGMLVVFLALIAIATFIANLPRLMALIDHKPAAVPAAAPADDPDEVIAVIAAAVEAALGPGHRVIHAQQVTSRELAWAQQGRWQHQTSHEPR